jgi:NitT/TauT family transport system permease protein
MYVLYTVPQVPFYPLFMLWFGLGFKSEVAFGVTHGIIPIIFGTMAAVAQVDQRLVDGARAMGASPLQRIRVVVLPAIVPGVVGALRVGSSLCLIGVLVAELLVSVDGIGGVIGQLAGTLQPAALDAVILAICVAAVLINVVIRLLERRLSRWRDLGAD